MASTCKWCTLFFLVPTVFLAGCAAAPPAMRYVWPAPPEQAKIEYIGAYRSQNDLIKKNTFALLTGEMTTDTLAAPGAIASDGNGKVYVVDMANGVVVFDFINNVTSTFSGDIVKPSGIAFDGDGNIYVGDAESMKISVFNKQHKQVSSINISKTVKSIGHFAIDKERKRLAVPDPKANKVHVFDLQGGLITTIDKYEGKESVFNLPQAVTYDKQGNIIVTDSMHARIVRFDTNGKFLSMFGERSDSPGDFSVIRGVAVDSEGHIYVTDAKANRFGIFSEKGEHLLSIGVPGRAENFIGAFQIPFGIYIDQNDTIFITEKFTKRFQKYQYLNAAYLAKNPITKDSNLAKPFRRSEGGKAK